MSCLLFGSPRLIPILNNSENKSQNEISKNTEHKKFLSGKDVTEK